ncbi:MAG: radical SAM protein [Flavobacteriaceae bacterium]|jgi:radical SAM protein with 4Fe4S-binding SPASM domain|nr:radical SAM protein [Flavobacteriaceae bacterium]
MKKIILNPAYILKPDDGRVLFMDKESVRSEEGDEGYSAFIHPIIAVVLNSMDGSYIQDCIKEASDILNVETDIVYNFIENLIGNKERYSLNYDGISYVFPKNTLILFDNDKYNKREKIDVEKLIYEKLDLRIKRHFTPTDITLMVNTICATDCIYCYADRRVKMNCKIPFERIKELIHESKQFNARSFNILGGELFLYKQWRELLSELNKNNYSPYISTKVALTDKEILDLKNIGIHDIQISLDTLVPSHMKDILKTKDSYLEKIKHSLILFEQYNIPVIIHTIVNSKNDNVEDIKSVYEFIKNLKNIKLWRIDLAESSLYHQNSFENFKADYSKIEQLYNFVKEKNFPINYDGIAPIKKEELTFKERFDNFKNRSMCSAHYSHLFIMPDGKVTSCEEFYWHPNFLLGDVIKNSLLEIWNSEKISYLYNIPQKDIPIDSLCSSCSDYEQCRSLRQVCYRDIMKSHGKDKWYYPDVKCPKLHTNDEDRIRVRI